MKSWALTIVLALTICAALVADTRGSQFPTYTPRVSAALVVFVGGAPTTHAFMRTGDDGALDTSNVYVCLAERPLAIKVNRATGTGPVGPQSECAITGLSDDLPPGSSTSLTR